ncbi:disease resistance protein PIK6-NP-like [Triticum dicoccoides]|uniref:disease resistance protein PIK6-NP-like n=1 Tax=Triticum dicoccoides TaxID=85692 RepID=UPI000E796C41|nr:disease resistance protein PIK6-NP-like [Triticum dicoccoides]XP_037450158.1 disease resistance protein PIK6-NP-like [Triticum dicoccoides]
MEAALVSAATGALKPVLGKLVTLLGDKYKRFNRVRKDIKSLTDELRTMHNFLLKMSEVEDLDWQDKVWMNEVRELSYDMEDAIDDFMLCVDDKDTKPDGILEIIKSSLGKMKARRRIGSEIQDLKKQIIEVGDRNARYKAREAFSKASNATVDHRALAIFEHKSKLVGIDEPKAEIIQILTQEDGCVSTQMQLKVVSIVGSGGMGKTTLANQVYLELKEKFECQAFCSVSQHPDMIKVLRTILSEVAKKDYAITEAMDAQQLIFKISRFLENKSYFIVVDDIWKNDSWDVIKCAFPVTSCGIIITTTRRKDVACSCRSSFNGHIYNIRPLDMMHSRQLFLMRLFNYRNGFPSHLEEVSSQILEKCGGLPLAIIAISSLLANRGSTKDQWDEVENSIGCALERNDTVDRMMKIMSLSYFDLPPDLKTCLLYLSIFPVGYVIDKQDLIRRWTAEGFIHKNSRYTVHEVGDMYFNELVDRSLIQPVKTEEHGKVNGCRVHNTILDFIISKSIEENFVTLVGVPNLKIDTESKVRRLSLHVEDAENSTNRLSLHVDDKRNSIPLTSLELSNVRSLTVFGQSWEIPSAVEFRHLRVFGYGSGCRHMKNHHLANMGSFFQLRYLNLSWTGISELPDQIRQAWCLELLDLRGTRIFELPATIINLRKLVHLFIDTGVKFPDGIEKMQALETLKQVGILKQPFNFPQELAKLRNLRKLSLHFHGDSATEAKNEFKNVIASCLHKLGNLRSLTVWSGGSFLQGPLCPVPLSLKKLVAWNSTICRGPARVGSLVNLQRLHLEVEGVSKGDLCILGSLPALLVLDLMVRENRNHRSLKVDGGIGFRSLRQFYYDIRDEAMNLIFAAGSMPELETLEISFDADQTESLNTSGGFDFGIENLPCLIALRCRVYRWQDRTFQAAKAAMERVASTHPNHPSIIVEPGTELVYDQWCQMNPMNFSSLLESFLVD